MAKSDHTSSKHFSNTKTIYSTWIAMITTIIGIVAGLVTISALNLNQGAVGPQGVSGPQGPPGSPGVPIGTIFACALSPDQLYETYGDSVKTRWMPADGREISTDSDYAKITGRTKLPDLRGAFLRGLNAFEPGLIRSDGLEDPDGLNRVVGDYQPDSIISHTHSVPMVSQAHDNSRTQITTNPNMPRWFDSIQDEVRTQPAGSTETRPGNIAVYYYILVESN